MPKASWGDRERVQSLIKRMTPDKRSRQKNEAHETPVRTIGHQAKSCVNSIPQMMASASQNRPRAQERTANPHTTEDSVWNLY